MRELYLKTERGVDMNTKICSFCEKPAHRVNLLIEAEHADICDECEFLCMAIVINKLKEEWPNIKKLMEKVEQENTTDEGDK